MIEKITKYKKYIISIVVVIILSTLFLGINYLKKNKKDEPLTEVKLLNIKDNKALAIMISNNGSDYQEYDSETFPGDEYEFKEAKCTNNNGDIVEEAVTFANGKATLKTNKTVYCTLYFDHKETIEILRQNDLKKILSVDEIGGMYRYQGVGTEEGIDDTHKLVDNNYICFGTSDSNICKNNENEYMYRIIGITKNGQLYLIKKDGVEEGNTKKFQWWENYSENIEWDQSLLYTRINGISNGNVSSSSGNTNIFVNNPKYQYMKIGSDWYNIIENHDWMYGDMFDSQNTMLDGVQVYGPYNNGIIVYQIETGQLPSLHYEQIKGNWQLVKYQWNKKIKAKVGLMYMHDYYLAYDNTNIYRSKYDTFNWLFIGNTSSGSISEWLMTRPSVFNNGIYYIWYVRTAGNIGYNALTDAHEIRPTFYVSNNIKLSGHGTIKDPYLINF